MPLKILLLQTAKINREAGEPVSPELATVSPTVITLMQTTSSYIEIYLMSTMDSAYSRTGMFLVFRVEVRVLRLRLQIRV